MKKLLIIIGVVFSPFFFVFGETVHLKDGSSIKGIVKSTTEDNVTLETQNGTLKIKKSDIETVDYGIRPRQIPEEQTENIKPVPSQEGMDQKGEQSAHNSSNHLLELIIKAGYDFPGDHDVSNANICASGLGCATLEDGSAKTTNGYSFSSDIFAYPTKNIGLGAGITYQFPRKQKEFDGDFIFIPFYGEIKFRTTPINSNTYLYVLGQLGYNGFYGDSKYKGEGGTLTGGMYAGVGGGLSFNNFILELLYSENNGSFEQSVYVPSISSTVYIAGDIKYTKTTLNVGYRWALN